MTNETKNGRGKIEKLNSSLNLLCYDDDSDGGGGRRRRRSGGEDFTSTPERPKNRIKLNDGESSNSPHSPTVQETENFSSWKLFQQLKDELNRSLPCPALPRAPFSRRVPNIIKLLANRKIGRLQSKVRCWGEYKSMSSHRFICPKLPPLTKSTISISFCADGSKFASTHGDHTVKVTTYPGGKIIQTLKGHQRTPWTVKFNPVNDDIVASGCLNFEVRVWKVSTGRCIYGATLDKHVVSLSFHPKGDLLALASVNKTFLWAYKKWRRAPILIGKAKNAFRCIEFPPSGTKIIVGETTLRPGRPQPPDNTVRLTMWDFNYEAAMRANENSVLEYPPDTNEKVPGKNVLYRLSTQEGEMLDIVQCFHCSGKIRVPHYWGCEFKCQSCSTPFGIFSKEYEVDNRVRAELSQKNILKEENGKQPLWVGARPSIFALSNRSVIVDHALLYNDGGFDISSCERFIAVCIDGVKTRDSEIARHRLWEKMVECDLKRIEENLLMIDRSTTSQRVDVPNSRATHFKFDQISEKLKEMTLRRNALHQSRAPEFHSNSIKKVNGHEQCYQIAVVSLSPGRSRRMIAVGETILGEQAREITSIKFSPTDNYLLLGYQRRNRPPLETIAPFENRTGLRRINRQLRLEEAAREAAEGPRRVASIYETSTMTALTTINRISDDINIALFHPIVGKGLVYGTKQGKIVIAFP